MTTKKSPAAKAPAKTSKASPAKTKTPSAPKAKKAEASPAEKAVPKTKANPFTRQTQQDIQLHTSRNADQDKLVTRSFTIYTSDDQHLKELTEELNKYSRKKVNNSLVIRTAINHLREAIQKGGARFEQDLERLIKDSI
jgi:deoxyadenosine/deoxycytidine kinase